MHASAGPVSLLYGLNSVWSLFVKKVSCSPTRHECVPFSTSSPGNCALQRKETFLENGFAPSFTPKRNGGSSVARWWSVLPMRPCRYDKARFTWSAATWSSKPCAQRFSSRAGRESSTLCQRRCQPPSRMSPLRYWRMGGVPVTRPPCLFP